MENRSEKPFFEIYSCIELYTKIKEDYKLIKESTLNSSKLLNLIFSINHLKDWVKNDRRLNKKFVREMGKTLNPSFNIEFSVIKVLCNGGKHFLLDKNNRKYKKLQIIYKGYGIGRYNNGIYGEGEPKYTVVIKEKEIDILDILTKVMNEIELIFKKYKNTILLKKK